MRQFATLQQVVGPSQARYTISVFEVDFYGLYNIILGSPRLQMAEGGPSHEEWGRCCELS